MKTKTSLRKALFRAVSPLLAASVLSMATAQTWQNDLVYQFVPSKSSYGRCLAADSLGNVFSEGIGDDNAFIENGVVLKTSATETTWAVIDDTNPNPGYYTSDVYSLGFDSNGNLYSIGQLWPDHGLLPTYWYVRKSADSGRTWATVDQYQYPSGSWINVTGITADNSGNIYVLGGATDGSGNRHWLVRKSGDAGQTWALVDDVVGNLAAQAAYVPGTGLFVVGNQGAVGWTVRRSLDAGATWATVDAPFTSGAGAWSVASDGRGNIYVVGSKSVTAQTTKPKHTVTYSVWITRMSADAGNTWSTVDTYTLAQNASAGGHALTMTATGSIVAVGAANDAHGSHWIVRTPTTSGAWQTIDNFQLSAGNSASAYGVVTDAAGTLLVTGQANGYPSGSYWVIRKLAK